MAHRAWTLRLPPVGHVESRVTNGSGHRTVMIAKRVRNSSLFVFPLANRVQHFAVFHTSPCRCRPAYLERTQQNLPTLYSWYLVSRLIRILQSQLVTGSSAVCAIFAAVPYTGGTPIL